MYKLFTRLVNGGLGQKQLGTADVENDGEEEEVDLEHMSEVMNESFQIGHQALSCIIKCWDEQESSLLRADM